MSWLEVRSSLFSEVKLKRGLVPSLAERLGVELRISGGRHQPLYYCKHLHLAWHSHFIQSASWQVEVHH